MSEEKKLPANDLWIHRLKHSVNRHTDPIYKLARHTIAKGTYHEIAYEEHHGSLHFAPPKRWMDEHKFTIPRGLLHCDGGGRPFSPAVDGGTALIYWLKPSALMANVPVDHAREILWKRAQALRDALQGKLGIEPLEYSLYFPPEKFRNATQGEPYETCAALILATDAANAKTLYQDVAKTIAEAKTLPKPKLPPETARMKAQRIKYGESMIRKLSQPMAADHALLLDDMAYHLRGDPHLTHKNEQGDFLIPRRKPDGSGKDLRCSAETLGFAANTQSLLVIPIDDLYRCNLAIRSVNSREEPVYSEDPMKDHRDQLTHLFSTLRKHYGEPIAGTHLFEHDSGGNSVLLISTPAPDADDILYDLRNKLKKRHREIQYHDARERDYFEDRRVEHRPPSR